jgi:4,5-dihydroxyphthalate decarboxylase
MSPVRDLPVTIAINDYDHVRDILSGEVPLPGIALTPLRLSGVEEIFFRFSRFREWDVSEMSLAKFVTLRAREEPIVAIPVFPSRMFRHSAIFVRADSPLTDLRELDGARIGVPEWTMTATVYTRGLLVHQYGVALSRVRWFKGGVNEPGRVEGIALRPPADVEVTRVTERSLTEMLLAGDIDAVMAAHPPSAFEDGSGRIRRLLTDARSAEADYYAETGVFPIMHVVALRQEFHEANPWVAMNLVTAFEEAKRRSLARLVEVTTARIPLPWAGELAMEAQQRFGADFWPYGIEPNRPTLETFLLLCHEQGLTERRLDPEELFVPQVQESYRI